MSAPLPLTDEPKIVQNPIVRLFASVDLRSLALFRVALGLLLVKDLWGRIAQVDSFYSNDGVLTNHFALFRPLAPYQFSFFFAASSTRDVTIVFLITMLVYLLFAAGYRTRLFQILSFLAVTSLHARNLLVELPSDAVIHVLLAWSLLLPLGERFSIDALRKSLRDRHEKSPAELNERPVANARFASVAVLGITLQIAAMHIGAALRQTGPSWSDGTALYYALQHNLWASDFGFSLAKGASAATLKLLTGLYKNAELVIGALVIVPVTIVRRLTIALLVAFHVFSAALFDVGPYDLAILAATPILLGSRDWEALSGWYAKSKRALVVYFDADCGICLEICRWLARFDRLHRLEFVPNTSDSAPPEVQALAAETVVVRDGKTGRSFTQAGALAAIFASLPLGMIPSLVLRAPGIAQLADVGYNLVAKNRTAISVWFGFQACGIPRPASAAALRRPQRWQGLAQAFAWSRETLAVMFLCLAGTAFWHGTLPEEKAPNLAEPVVAALSYPRIFQKWGLFAPEPPKEIATVVIDAWNGRGLRFDPLSGGLPRETPVREPKPEGSVRPTPLMSAYFVNMGRVSNANYIDGLKDYVTRIGDERTPADRPTAWTALYVEAPMSPPGSAAPFDSSQLVRRRLVARP
ncbi:MAG: DCC1-like thiol-disulfide oxidoreductase family protein [Polyangiaceae bacterium]